MKDCHSTKLFAPWCVTDTVYSDRKNLFCLAPTNEFHIGTLVSGSRSQLARFESALPLIRHAPDMAILLAEIVEAVDGEIEEASPASELLKRAKKLIDLVALPYREG